MVLASPVLVVILGHFAARIFLNLFDIGAWVGTSLVYWGSMITITFLLGGKKHVAQWFSKSQGSRWWAVLAIAVGLISFPLLFIPNMHVLSSIPLLVAWFVFGAINATCEEVYWRGFLLDETRYLPRTFGVIYSTVLFTILHPLMLGVYSKIQAFDPTRPLDLLPFILILLMLSFVFCLLYLKTKSLRLPILAHFLSDLGNLSIFVFMNIITM